MCRLGETYVEAAIRELREETGIEAHETQVGAPTWRRHATFRFRGERRLQHEAVVTVHLATEAPSISGALRVGYENDNYFGYRWRPVVEITESVERLPESAPATCPRPSRRRANRRALQGLVVGRRSRQQRWR
jgi:8-oxo-dGTP pyrophosphatase MutT (NUDIX family)